MSAFPGYPSAGPYDLSLLNIAPEGSLLVVRVSR
jgi:hypothetical protein